MHHRLPLEGNRSLSGYVRPAIKRRDTQTLHCPAAPAGVIKGSRADVSFLVGLLLDKFAWHLPLYRQHQRLADAVSGQPAALFMQRFAFSRKLDVQLDRTRRPARRRRPEPDCDLSAA
jgi:hypothetical protein